MGKRDRSNLASNIRALRKAYGESQEEMAAALNFEKSTISNYENGVRTPDSETISAIAKHFSISMEEILLEDFSDIEKMNFDNNHFWENIGIIFPIIESNDTENKYCIQALKNHIELYNLLKVNSEEAFSKLPECINGYIYAFDDKKSKDVASANYLALWHLVACFDYAIRFVQESSAAINMITKNNNEILQGIEELKEKPEVLLFLQEFFGDSTIEEYFIKTEEYIKRSHFLSDLSYYYIAVRYIYGIIGNGLEIELNRRIGKEMMEQFALLGNIYALNYMRYIYSIKDSSRSVDEK